MCLEVACSAAEYLPQQEEAETAAAVKAVVSSPSQPTRLDAAATTILFHLVPHA